MAPWLDDVMFPEPWLDLRRWRSRVRHHRLIARLTRELRKEIAANHPLASVGWKIIGFGTPARDDVLLALSDGNVAIAHVTWKGSQEALPWPSTVILSSREQSKDELIDRGYDVL